MRERLLRKCTAETNSDYADLIDSANKSLTGYDRNEIMWDLKLTGTQTRTDKIFVWKATASAVYYRIKTGETAAKNIFIKVSNTINNDLFRSLQEEICKHDLYEGSESSSSATLKRNDPSFTPEGDSQYKFFRTWVFKSNESVLFGNLRYNQKKQNYNDDEVATTSSTDDFTITTGTKINQDSEDYTDAEYGTVASRYYCLIKSVPHPNGAAYQKYNITSIDLTNPDAATGNLECETGSNTPTVTQGTETFTPGSELLIP